MGFEDKVSTGMFSGYGEKTFIDKVLAKDDVKAIQELIKKPRLTREELLEILYLISGTEAKLLNYSEWDRYVILKFFIWIREFIKIAELLFDYEDSLAIKENTCKTCKLLFTGEEIKCKCKTPIKSITITKRTRKLLDNNSLLIQHNAKFLIDLYLNISRTSMSLGMSAFLEMVRNKYEVEYNPTQPPASNEKKGGLLGFMGGNK
jgi:hypothetical protein